MSFDFEQIKNFFEQYKSSKDFKDYVDEINECNSILYTIPFDAQRAQQQISKLTTKYQEDFNWLATYYGNGMAVTHHPVPKTAQQLFNDLQYVSNHIPVIALRRQGISKSLKNCLGCDIT